MLRLSATSSTVGSFHKKTGDDNSTSARILYKVCASDEKIKAQAHSALRTLTRVEFYKFLVLTLLEIIINDCRSSQEGERDEDEQ